MKNQTARRIARASLYALMMCLLGQGAWGITAHPSQGSRIQSTVQINANQWEMPVDNLGRHCAPIQNKPTGFWPAGSGRNYIYGAGIWVGAINRNVSPADTQVSHGYECAYGYSNYMGTPPDGDETKYLDAAARVYSSTNPTDVGVWPVKDSTGKPVIKSLQDSWTKFNDVDLTHMGTGERPIGVEVTRTTFMWPYAGYKDLVFYLFWVKNVTGTRMGNPRTLTDMYVGNCTDCDIGAESAATGNDIDTLENSSYWKKIPGRTDSVLQTRNLAMQYQTVQETGWSLAPPYYMGWRFFLSPKNNTGQTIQVRSQPGIGYDQFDRDILPDSALGMTAFQTFINGTDPSKPAERYLELTGRYWRTPTIYNALMKDHFGPTDKRFIQASGPFNLAAGDSVPFVVGLIGGLTANEVIQNSDKAQVIFDANFIAPYPPVSPNLSLIPGDHKVTLFWDNKPEYTKDGYYAYLDSAARRRYRAYDLEGYRVYKARNQADLSDPAKRKMIGWFKKQDGFTIVLDAQPKFRDLPNGQKETLQVWDTLGTDNGLRYSLVDSGQFIGQDSMGLVNGLPYFYGVTGFDYQWYTQYDTIARHYDTLPGSPTTLESNSAGKFVIVVPRADPGDLTPGKIDSTTWQVHGGAFTSGLKYLPNLANQDSVKQYPHTYKYEWLPIGKKLWSGTWGNALGAYNLIIRDLTNNDTIRTWKVVPGTDTMPGGAKLVWVVDTIPLGIDTTLASSGSFIYTPAKLEMFHGIEFGLLDTVKLGQFKSGTISVSRGTPIGPLLADTATGSASTPRFGFKVQNWAFRGSQFVITWHKRRGTVRGDSIWAEVYDSTNQVVVPPETLAVQDLAKVSGWCFGGNGTSARGKLWIDSTMVSITGTNDTIPIPTRYPGTWLTLCGRRYWFKGKLGGYDGRPMLWTGGLCPINEGDVWIVQQQGFQVPCEGNWMQFTPTPGQVAAGGKAMLDAIKVVPNPYLVRNNWDTDRYSKHLMFTHLPTKCTIRIYTLAGDLVKIIYHDGSQNSFAKVIGGTPTGGTGGTESWDLLTYNSQLIASGVYLFHVEAPGIGNKIGKFAVIQ